MRTKKASSAKFAASTSQGKAKDTPQVLVAPPLETSPSFPIVSIGASAGGLEAIEIFFTHVPPDCGMAFVIVQHFDPNYESILTDLLNKKFTRMPVTLVGDKLRVEPNHVYVIPSNMDMELRDGVLHLVQRVVPPGLHLPIVSDVEAAREVPSLSTLSEKQASVRDPAEQEARSIDSSYARQLAELEQELRSTREHFRAVIAEMETTNRRLQSSNEELEASKKELQSVNEGLTAANAALQSKVDELRIADVAQSKRVEDKASNSQQLMNALFENAPIGIQIFDKQGFSQRMNGAQKRLLGLTDTQAGVGEFNVFMDPLVKATNQQEIFRRAYAGETVTNACFDVNLGADENTWQTKKSTICVEQTIFPLRDAEGEVSAVVALVQDVGERIRVERALRASEKHFKELFHSFPLPSFIWHVGSSDLRLVDVNHAADVSSGNQAHTYIGRTAAEIYPNRPDIIENLQKCFREKSTFTQETEYVTRSTGKSLIVVFTYVFVHPDLVMLHTENVTERKRAAESLRESEEKFKVAFHDNAVALLLTSASGICVDANKALCELAGYTREELVGKPLRDFKFVDEADRQVVMAKERAFGAAKNVELTVRSRNGQKHTVLLSTQAVTLNGAPHRIATNIDITELKNAEQTIRQQGNTLQTIFDNIPIMLAYFDDKGNVKTANNALVETLGWSVDELQKMDLLAACYPDANLRQNVIDWMLSGNLGWKEFRTLTRSGKTIETMWTNRRLADGTSIGIGQDITERKQAEALLLQARERTQNIMDTMLDGGQIIDRDWRYLYLNDACLKQSSYQRREDLLGFTMMEKYPGIEDTEVFSALRRCMKERTPYRMENQFVFPDGSISWFDLTIQPVPDGLFILSQDISERKRSNAAQQARDKQMVESQRLQSLGLLAGGVAHDVNNLLAPIWTNIELLRLAHGNAQDASDLFDATVAAIQRVRDLIRQMLAYAGRHPMSLVRVDLNQLIRGIQTLLNPSLPKNVVVQLDLASEPLILVADETQLQQVVMNVILNAAESFGGRAGTIVVHSRREVSEQTKTGAEAVLVVRDTGPGIAPENLSRIFDPFFTTKPAGHGLGLSATQGIVRAHQGELEVQSVVGEGTTFIIRLPLGAPETPQSVSPAATMMPPQPLQGLWLVIDDEALVRRSTCRVLKLLNLRAIQAEDGATGLALAHASAADLSGVVLDLTMPGMSGREVFERLRADYPRLPVVILSGYSEHLVQDLLTQPNVAFVAKPCPVKTLEETIRRLSQ